MGYPTVNGVPLDQIFDPYISGTKAPITNYTVRISGVDVDLRDLFAPIYLGTSAAPTKYKVNNADLNTFFAKKGTAQYGLPINGRSFTAHPTSAGSSSSASLNFNTNNSTFSVSDPNFGTMATGPVPAAAATCKVTFTLSSGTPATDELNPLSSFTALSGSTVTCSVGNFVLGSGNPALRSTYSINIQYQNSSGVVVSTTNCTFVINTNPT